jgi:hypothetical protein
MLVAGSCRLARRDFLAATLAIGVAPSAALAAPPAIAADPADPVRRLLSLASQNAFTRLTTPDGFWNSSVARFGLPVLFRKTASNASGPLGQDPFREQLQRRLNRLAELGARGGAPVVEAAVRKLAVPDPAGILRGKPTAAATLLRVEMQSDLVNAMIPPMEQALVAAQDPIVAQAVAALVGVKLFDVAHSVALAANNGIWYEIGGAEADIRGNPQGTNDPELVAALRGV